jgi:hypothetical protein
MHLSLALVSLWDLALWLSVAVALLGAVIGLVSIL